MPSAISLVSTAMWSSSWLIVRLFSPSCLMTSASGSASGGATYGSRLVLVFIITLIWLDDHLLQHLHGAIFRVHGNDVAVVVVVARVVPTHDGQRSLAADLSEVSGLAAVLRDDRARVHHGL